MNNSIERHITVQASIDTVWNALTQADQVSKWFGQTAQFELKVGATGWFGWQDYGQFAVRIEHIEPCSYFAWRWMAEKDVPFKLEDSTLVEWRLQAIDDNSTDVILLETGFKTSESHSDNCAGWTEELSDLVNYFNV